MAVNRVEAATGLCPLVIWKFDVEMTGSLIEKRQVGSIIGQARDQRDNNVQTARRSEAKSR